MFDHGAHLLSIRSSKLKAELDNNDSGVPAKGEMRKDVGLRNVTACRNQRSAPQSGQHLDINKL